LANLNGFKVSGSCIDCCLILDDFNEAVRLALDRLEDGEDSDFISIINVATNEIALEIDNFHFKLFRTLDVDYFSDLNPNHSSISRMSR